MKKNKARDRLKADMRIVNIQLLMLNSESYITKDELREKASQMLGEEISEREMRKARSYIRFDRNLIADNEGKGFKFAKHTDKMTDADKLTEKVALMKQIRKGNNLIETEKMKLRPLIATLKMYEKADKIMLEMQDHYKNEYDCRG